ncbi:MAG: hypothetical protein AABZ47_08870 [Planctomycetota bacterium]
MGLQDILAVMVGLAAVFYLARVIRRTLRKSGSCHCSHSKATGDKGSTCGAPSLGIVRRPIVPIEKLGRPDSRRTNS